ncbi:MAG: hypothetical protein KC643_07155, partial [Nitrospira sp.]|nr:hypothetical protein [Nitrospira sp.]
MISSDHYYAKEKGNSYSPSLESHAKICYVFLLALQSSTMNSSLLYPSTQIPLLHLLKEHFGF